MWAYSDNLEGRRINPAVLLEVCSFVFGDKFDTEAQIQMNNIRREAAAKLKRQEKEKLL